MEGDTEDSTFQAEKSQEKRKENVFQRRNRMMHNVKVILSAVAKKLISPENMGS